MTLLVVATVAGCTPGDDGDDGQPGGDRDYRGDMRAFVQRISAAARAARPGFIVISQNGHDLLARGVDAGSGPADEYLAAIDGVGREDLFYGYDRDDAATPEAVRDGIIAFLDIARAVGKAVLVTDYCSTRSRVDDSYAQNAARGFVSFAADRRELDNVPAYPAAPPGQNAADVTRLSQVRNFLYLLNPGAFGSRDDYVAALRGAPHDLLLIDAFVDGDALSADEVASLRTKPGGGRRLVVAYMSIGEAENYRYYWQSAWNRSRPGFVVAENADFAGNFVVRYWEDAWQEIILGAGGYLERIVAAGFDGVYLDIIDAFEYFESL